MDADAAAQEYTDLFIGVGQCEVNLHGSHWIAGAMLERPLAELRSALAALGLGRRRDVVMLEDHLSALFETMRLLVAGESDRPPASLPRSGPSSSATSRRGRSFVAVQYFNRLLPTTMAALQN
jgi:TorA maturation chaperone TorD